MSEEITRREFVRAAAAAGVSAWLLGCAAKRPPGGSRAASNANSVRAWRKRYRPLIDELKATGQLRIVDTHVHPTDVMNVVDSRMYQKQDGGWALGDITRPYQPQDLERVGLLGRLGHSRWQWWIERLAVTRFPAAVASAIMDAYAYIGQRRIEDERAICGVDALVLLAVSPFCPPDEVHRFYGVSDSLHYLGSIDPHAIDPDRVEDEIRRQKRTLGIIGLKLHPNLQAFHPFPPDNPPEVAERLHRAYRAAEKLGLYVLLHSGRSNILPAAHQTDRFPRATARAAGHFGLLEHYCDADGRSRLFEDYRCSFVLAHIGSYAIEEPDHDRIFGLCERYHRVSFDTSNAPPRLIARFVERLGAEQLLFGSDGFYNRQLAELVNCLRGIEDGSRKDCFEENATRILGRNFSRLIGSKSICTAS